MRTLLTLALAATLSAPAFAQFGNYNDFQFINPLNKKSLNNFETSKVDTTKFEGLRVNVGGAFVQTFQGLTHSNEAAYRKDSVLVNNKLQYFNSNELKAIGNGFNNASANLVLDVQLADGIRMNLTTYLSTRHHQETWVKGGYLQFDKLPLGLGIVDEIMKYTTLKIGHMEINYGDAHFRRTDAGNSFLNPFLDNYIIDAFTTEIGAEAYFQHSGFLVMAGATSGEIKGDVTVPERRQPTVLGKLGYDRQLTDNIRVRLTGSIYNTAGSASNTLLGGDRSGSTYFWVMENVNPTNSTTAQATSGRFNPGFGQKVQAIAINPFVKVYGFELFGDYEIFTGRARTEPADDERTWTQLGVDGVFRFGADNDFYVAARYNTVTGELARASATVDFIKPTIDRTTLSAGWYLTNNVLAKAEYVMQNYKDFPVTDIRNGGKFQGFMLAGSVAF